MALLLRNPVERLLLAGGGAWRDVSLRLGLGAGVLVPYVAQPNGLPFLFLCTANLIPAGGVVYAAMAQACMVPR